MGREREMGLPDSRREVQSGKGPGRAFLHSQPGRRPIEGLAGRDLGVWIALDGRKIFWWFVRARERERERCFH